MGTKFTDIYNRFLGKITDDLYIELTPEDTIKDLRAILLNILPEFEFPRFDIYDYTIDQEIKYEDEILEDDFVIGLLWEDETNEESEIRPPRVMVEHSSFGAELTPEEINILAILMMVNWVQRQVTSIEHTRMKYSGSDFKMTSQANHLQKLMSLLSECQRQSFHMQRLYKRRKLVEGKYESNWGVFHYKNYPYDN